MRGKEGESVRSRARVGGGGRKGRILETTEGADGEKKVLGSKAGSPCRMKIGRQNQKKISMSSKRKREGSCQG